MQEPKTVRKLARRRDVVRRLATWPILGAAGVAASWQANAQTVPEPGAVPPAERMLDRGIRLRPVAMPAPLWPRRFSESVGLQVKFYQGQPASTLGLMGELGLRWVREELHWSDFEPRPGEFKAFPPEFVERLRWYRRQGIGVLFLLAYSNTSAYPDTPEQPHRSIDPTAFAVYAVEVAKRLQAEGVEFVLEVWNEPHHGELQRKLGGSWQGADTAGQTAPWVLHYVRIVQAVLTAVRRLDPKIRVFAQDDMWIVHYWFLKAGLPADLDGLSVHPYQPRPERAAVDPDTPWTQPFQTVDADGSFRSAVARLQREAQRRMGRVPAIWISEVGWIQPKEGAKWPVSEALQAAYLPRIYIGAFLAGVEVTCWYSAFDVFDEGPWGLLDKQARPRPALQAFRTMSAAIGPMLAIGHVHGQDRPTTGLQAAWFARSASDQCVVLWSADDAPRQVTLSCRRAMRSDGSTLVAGAGRLRQHTLEVGAAPVYAFGAWRAQELRLLQAKDI